MAGPFTDAQRVDIRRYCGYPAYAHYGWVFEEDYATLELRMDNMSANEAAVVTTTYLPALASLELAVPAAADNLDTDEAAVWKHNKNEVGDRLALFDEWRTRLCGFIGVRAGRALSQRNRLIRT